MARYGRASMRRVLLIALLLTACDGGAGDDDAQEATARAAIERRGLESVTLERVDDLTWDFTGTLEGAQCAGSIQVRPGGTASAMQYDCE